MRLSRISATMIPATSVAPPRAGDSLAVGLLSLVVLGCSDAGPVPVKAVAMDDAVRLTVSQRAFGKATLSVESVLTLTIREGASDLPDWFVEQVSYSFRPTFGSLPTHRAPTSFGGELHSGTSGGQGDGRSLTQGTAREFAVEVPNHRLGEKMEVQWQVRFVNQRTEDRTSISTEWALVR